MALWIVLLPNNSTLLSFYNAAARAHLRERVLFVLGGVIAALLIVYAFLALVAAPFRGQTVRWVAASVLVTASIPGYFTTFYGTLFDRTMLLNIVQTNPGESWGLASVGLVLWVAILGVLPAWLAMRVRIEEKRSFIDSMLRQVAGGTALVVLTGAIVAARYPRYASAARTKQITIHRVPPINLVASSVDHLYAMRGDVPRAAVGRDARVVSKLEKPRLVVLVLGETARAKNVGLNGYGRDTTPRMCAAGGLYFPDTEACGTATSISVPCIFSGLPRDDFTLSKARSRATLLDVVAHSGARVMWCDNDGGSKGVCDRVDSVDRTKSDHPALCPEIGNCYDELLLEGLAEEILLESRDTLLVLHIKGSHGPAYFKRVPPKFELFTPVCHSSDLAICVRASLINAYDNTILYTDDVIGGLISLLRHLEDRFTPALVHVSDHGESLGESGLYLHGMPVALAPLQQMRVPMFVWFADSFITRSNWSSLCLKQVERGGAITTTSTRHCLH